MVLPEPGSSHSSISAGTYLLPPSHRQALTFMPHPQILVHYLLCDVFVICQTLSMLLNLNFKAVDISYWQWFGAFNFAVSTAKCTATMSYNAFHELSVACGTTLVNKFNMAYIMKIYSHQKWHKPYETTSSSRSDDLFMGPISSPRSWVHLVVEGV